MLVTEKSYETFPKHNIVEVNKIKVKQNFFLVSFSAVNECPPNPCVGPFPKIKMSFPLLSIRTDELISTPKIIALLPKLPSGCVKTPLPSNPIQYPEYLYLSTSTFLVVLTPPNKQFSKVKSGL